MTEQNILKVSTIYDIYLKMKWFLLLISTIQEIAIPKWWLCLFVIKELPEHLSHILWNSSTVTGAEKKQQASDNISHPAKNGNNQFISQFNNA